MTEEEIYMERLRKITTPLSELEYALSLIPLWGDPFDIIDSKIRSLWHFLMEREKRANQRFYIFFTPPCGYLQIHDKTHNFCLFKECLSTLYALEFCITECDILNAEKIHPKFEYLFNWQKRQKEIEDDWETYKQERKNENT